MEGERAEGGAFPTMAICLANLPIDAARQASLLDESPTQWAPEGPRRIRTEGEWVEGVVKLKLHAVAPGGPPEGQCEIGESSGGRLAAPT